MPKLTYDNYTQIPFHEYYVLREKMKALFDGHTLMVMNLNLHTGKRILVRLEQKKFDVTQIAEDIKNPEWLLYNVGVNDLSLACVFRYDEELFSHKNKFMKNDVVQFNDKERAGEAVVVDAVFESNTFPGRYAYTLNGAYMLYAEDELAFKE